MRFIVVIIILVFPVSGCLAQTAGFTSDATSGCMPSLTVNFHDQSTGNPSTWAWDFGNGNTSKLQHPSAVYTQPGTYSVTLTVSGGSTITKTAYIQVHDVPVVNFSADVVAGCAPLAINFSNASSAGEGTIIANNWVFGDGGTDNGSASSYTYKQPGTYSVTLSVTNQFNCVSTTTKNSLIVAKGPLVDFAFDQPSYCVTPATVHFTNNTTGQGTPTYTWDFGDNTPVEGTTNPTHQYASAGNYSISLSATDASGCSLTAKKTISIGLTDPGAVDFTMSAAQVCIGQEVAFEDASSIFVLTRVWDFGDGTQSTTQAPSIKYTKAGIYQVTMTATLSSGCQAVVSKDVEVLFDPVPSFKITQGCNPTVSFVNTTQYASTYQWDFGDGNTATDKDPTHAYSSAGEYKVKLTAYNALNCSIELDTKITVTGNPVASISPSEVNSCTEPSLSGCAPFTIDFQNNSSSDKPLTSTLWSFGDNTTSSSSSPKHTYTNAGKYQVMLAIKDSRGCRDTARVIVAVSRTIPKADFSVDKVSVCEGEDVTFTNLSQNADFWCWDFGDMANANSQDVTHKYLKPGTYTVTLTAKNAGCSDVIIKKDLITVRNPDFDFSTLKTCGTPFDLQLINNSKNFDFISWDFGDGTTGNNDAPGFSHHYQATGTYTVKAAVTNVAAGCTVHGEANVVIQDVKADFSPNNNPVCKNGVITFKDQSQFAVKWNWDFDDSNTDTVQNPLKSYPDAGLYNVKLTVTDSDNCTDTKSLPVKVADMEGKFSYTASSDCTNLTVVFEDQSQGFPPIQKWLWDFGDGQTSTIQDHPQHVYHQLQSYTVTLTLQNSEAVCSTSVVDAVVFTKPTPDFKAPKTDLCLNEPLTIFNQSMFAQYFTWDVGNGAITNDPVPSVSYDGTGTYDVTLTAKDIYGCEKTITKPDYLTVWKPKASLEAIQTSTECPPLITSFKDHSSTDVTNWQWTFGDGQFSTLQNPTNTYLIPGIYNVSLQVTDRAGCSDVATVNGLISVGGPYGSFVISTQPICENQGIQFDATATNTLQYIYDFGDGTVLNAGSSSATHIYNSHATYNTSLTLVDSKGCKVVVGNNTKVVVKEVPKIDFDFYYNYSFENESIKFVSNTGKYTLAWDIDGLPDASDSIIERAFDHYGVHHVKLNALNGDGCSQGIEKDIYIQGDISMIPNVFTPNDTDDYNTTFEITDLEKGFWGLKVYNRWGGEVYHNDFYQNDWTGDGLSPGVYYYHLINHYRKEKQFKGYVQIIR